MKNWKKHLFNFYFGILTVAVMGLMMLVMIQVITRYFFGISPIWMEETISYLLVFTGLIGSSFAFYENRHVALVFLHDKVSPRKKAMLQIFVDICVICFALLVQVVGGLLLVDQTKDRLSMGTQYPLIYINMLVPISGAITIVLLLIAIKDKLPALKKEG